MSSQRLADPRSSYIISRLGIRTTSWASSQVSVWPLTGHQEASRPQWAEIAGINGNDSPAHFWHPFLFGATSFPANWRPTSLAAALAKSRTECCTPVAITKSFSWSCRSISYTFLHNRARIPNRAGRPDYPAKAALAGPNVCAPIAPTRASRREPLSYLISREHNAH